jgi:hypothetical protein
MTSQAISCINKPVRATVHIGIINLSGITDTVFLENCRSEVRRIIFCIDDVIDAVEQHVDSLLKMAEG